jgi:hypothetical protein
MSQSDLRNPNETGHRSRTPPSGVSTVRANKQEVLSIVRHYERRFRRPAFFADGSQEHRFLLGPASQIVAGHGHHRMVSACWISGRRVVQDPKVWSLMYHFCASPLDGS